MQFNSLYHCNLCSCYCYLGLLRENYHDSVGLLVSWGEVGCSARFVVQLAEISRCLSGKGLRRDFSRVLVITALLPGLFYLPKSGCIMWGLISMRF